MKKYNSACSSLRPGQLDRSIAKIKDFNPTTHRKNIIKDEKIECLKKLVEWFEYNRNRTHEIWFKCCECKIENYFEEHFDDINIPDCIVDAKRLIQLSKEK